MDFARKQLEKYGWSEGKGLGRKEDGISTALKPKLKFDNSGVGHDIGEQFTNNWWEKVFNNAADNIHVEMEESDVKVKIKDEDAVEISTKNYSIKELKKNTNMEYGSFIKTAKLTENGVENFNVAPVTSTEPLKSFQGLTDDELFAACGGRTAHKGARHGLKLSGKLSRIEKQERLLLKKMKKVSLCDESCTKVEKKLKKLKNQKEECREKYTVLPECEAVPSTSSIKTKKNKKRKSVSFNETVTKIYTPEVDACFDSEVGSLKDENSNDAPNNNSGSDEGIEQDLENNNNDQEIDNHRAFEEARLNFKDLSKAERKKLKKKRKLDAKLYTSTGLFIQSLSDSNSVEEQMQEDKDLTSKKRKHYEEIEDSKRTETESPNRLKRKKNKKKKMKQKQEEAKVISSITKSLEGFCRISESE